MVAVCYVELRVHLLSSGKVNCSALPKMLARVKCRCYFKLNLVVL